MIGHFQDGALRGYGQKYVYHPTFALYEVLWGNFTGAVFDPDTRVGAMWDLHISVKRQSVKFVESTKMYSPGSFKFETEQAQGKQDTWKIDLAGGA